MASIDRRAFAPPQRSQYAYLDVAQPIGHGAIIEAPSVHALSLALLHANLKDGSTVLDVGSGSGYLAAVIAN